MPWDHVKKQTELALNAITAPPGPLALRKEPGDA